MKCTGSDCKCQANTGEYCSDECKTANDHGHCHCDHPECKS